MVLQAAAFVGAGLLITILHTLAPDHWLPFVVVGRARRWPTARTMRLTLLFAVGHVGLTILLGLAIALVSIEFLKGVEGFLGMLTAALLIALGLLFVGLHAGRRAGDHSPVGLDGAAGTMVVSILALPPCYPILPLFLSVQALGWGMTLGLAFLFAIVTMAMMLALVLGASKGLLRASEAGAWASLERHEGFILGGVLMALGAVSLWL